jgi:hypothetical protein
MMRAARGTVLAVTIAAVALLGVAGVAHAGDGVGDQAWTDALPAATFSPQAGHLYAAQNVGVEEARAFVHVDPGAMPADVTSGVGLTLVEAADTSVVSAGALLACPLTTPLTASGQVSSAAAPSVDCASAAPAVRAADGTWSVPVDALLPGWRNGSTFGVALVPAPSQSATFRIAFDPAKTVLAIPAATGAATDTLVTDAVPAAGTDVTPGALSDAALGGLSDPLSAAPAPTGTVAADLRAASTLPLTTIGPAVATPTRHRRNAASPPAAVVLGLVGLATLGGGLTAGRRRRPPSDPNLPRLGANTQADSKDPRNTSSS